MYKYPDTVEEAAILFDQIYPGWAAKIDLNNFSMKFHNCILAQLYPEKGYSSALYFLFPDIPNIGGTFAKDDNLPLWKDAIKSRTNKE